MWDSLYGVNPRVTVMKRFVLADGDILFKKPVVVHAVRQNSWGWWKFDMVLPNGAGVQYRSQWKVEVTRERDRLLSFNWSEKSDGDR